MTDSVNDRKSLLAAVRAGRLSVEDAVSRLRREPHQALESEATQASQGPDTADDTEALLDSLRRWLAGIVAAEARVEVAVDRPELPLEHYGFDSVMAVNVVRVLERDFGKLPTTLLFEHQSIEAIAQHLIAAHRDAVRRLLLKPAASETPPPASEPPSALSSLPSWAPEVGSRDEDIAIVGLSCVFPMAENAERFWENLVHSRDCVTEIPAERWDADRYFDPTPGTPGKYYTKWGGFIADVDCFDAAFFHLSPREAERMDPQERLLLQEVWHAMEDAGICPDGLSGDDVGVYVGTMSSQYQLHAAEQRLLGNPLFLGSSYASIANRVSYTFGFRGPSMALDTMCSSSLTAIHLACDALRGGDIGVAVAAGVSLLVHPNKYIDLSQGRYASTDGRCRSFGAGGTGYVPGEGAGVVILKPLRSAEAAGDRIHAVIRGSALGHGGKTNGYTVPNPVEQSRVIAAAIRRAEVSPAQIGYVEAHGTGTELGDPIEVASLSKVMAGRAPQAGECAFGSVKSNIGHLESAAGVAGLIKVVLQMRHRQLVPSLHADTLNPEIDFTAAPLRPQRTLASWELPQGQDRRVAGISSFGAGGANAHVIVAEYLAEPAQSPIDTVRADGPELIVLSAANEEGLRRQAALLADHLAVTPATARDERGWLADVGYTLRQGRQALEERLAIVAESVPEAVAVLRGFGAAQATAAVIRGGIDRPAPAGGERAVAEAVAGRDLDRLGRLWADGAKVDWSALDRVPRRRIALPAYPFERERHWPRMLPVPASVESRPVGEPASGNPRSSVTVLDATDPLLRDHVVHGRSILPAAGVVDLVQAAARGIGLSGPLTVQDIVFQSPVTVADGGSGEVTVELADADGDVGFLVRSRPRADAEPVVHARGRVRTGADPAAALDPQALAAVCPTVLDAAACYRQLAGRGLEYGPVLRVLDEVRRGPGQAVGALRDGASSAGLPAILDGAFQTLVGFEPPEADGAALVPFAVDRLDLLGPVDTARWVHARAAGGSTDDSGRPRMFDIDVAAADGGLVLRVRGLLVRPAAAPAGEAVVLRPKWVSAEPAAGRRGGHRILLVDHGGDPDGALTAALRAAPDVARLIRIQPGARFERIDAAAYRMDPADPDDCARLLAELDGAGHVRSAGATAGVDGFDIVHIHGPADGAAVSPRLVEEGFYRPLTLATALARHASAASVRQFHVHPIHDARAVPAYAATAAFGRALAAEHPGFRLVTLGIEPGPEGWTGWPSSRVARLLAELAGDPDGGEEIRYVGGERQRRVREMLSADTGAVPGTVLRSQGVYIVTGGFGGLGRALARYLAETYNARLVLVGRSVPASDATVSLDTVASVAADVSTEAGACEAAFRARTEFGRIDGVFHLAGVLRDGLIFGKQRGDAESVLAPKIWGAHHLDLATRGDQLDFFALFSSASSVIGIPGQSDYAYANGFLDAFAAWREDMRRAGERSGRTVSIAWPLWESGGMDIGESAKQAARRELGWIALPQARGLRLLETALGGAEPELAVFFGHRPQILSSCGVPDNSAIPAPPSGQSRIEQAVPVAASGTAPALLAHVRRLVADELKLPVERLPLHRRFDQVGIESVMAMNVTAELETVFGRLPKTLFFEYRSVAELAGYLQAAFPVQAATFGAPAGGDGVADSPGAPDVPDGPDGPDGPDAQAAPPRAALTVPPKPSAEPDAVASMDSAASEPIAIVGLAGRYPMADTLEELWRNLRSGRDCVTEIPPERWDKERYFDPSGERPATGYSKWGGFLRDLDRFDPLFFNIPPREARQMDPQERLFLETAWHALEDAGHTRRSLDGRCVGVFVGVMYAQYQLYGAEPGLQAEGFVPASLSASVANRVSYCLDLTGPSIALDTMCSSSLTALHLACSSIRLGDCDEALVGGVNAILHPNRYLQLSQNHFASTDGRCRSFGAGGDGYVPGEGVGAVLIKPLRRALADGDHVYGVIRATGVNHGGRSNGFTVPTPVSQAELISRTLRAAGVEPQDVGYIEAHGTGTALGDPIEIAGLRKAFDDLGGRRGPSCPVGSIKSNIGHLESAAGIAGLTKVLLQMRHGELVPSLHAEELNPHLDLDGRLHVQRVREAWPAGPAERPRVAIISSFGAGGSNGHVVVQEYRPAVAARPAQANAGGGLGELIVLSARTEEQLGELAGRLADRLDPVSAADRSQAPDSAPDSAGDPVPVLRSLLGEILGVPGEDFSLEDDLESLGLDQFARSWLVARYGEQTGARISTAGLNGWCSLRDLAALLTPLPVATSNSVALRDVAFTLRAGREPLAERLAFVARDLADTVRTLRGFAAGESPAGIARGRVVGDETPLAELFDGSAGQAFVEGLHRAGELEKLAGLWAAGVDVPWSGPAARRLSLALYPFARDRYWVPEVVRHAAVPLEVIPEPEREPAPTPEPVADRNMPDVHGIIVSAMAAVLEVPPEEFVLDVPHLDFGIDSILAVEIVDRVNRQLGVDLRPTDFFNHATLRRLVAHVEQLCAEVTAPVHPPVHPPEIVRVDPAPAQAPVVAAEMAEGIAVIGMSARFPDAPDLDRFWANLVAGRDSVREIPGDRWDVEAFFDPDPQAAGKTYSKWGSILDDAAEFDPDFFGISPREARLMDPQQRLYLMEAWRALESAGYSDRALDGLAVHSFVGTSTGDYHHLLRSRGVDLEGYTFTGTHPAILASRASYFLNLTGPSMAVDTSCSSSLLAVHLACEAIRSGRAEMAVAGGVAALFTPELHVLASKAGMLSPTGRCRAFASSADGFVPGEGVGAVVLKGLAQALRDGDPIRGVILGSGTNQDGRTNGITAPSAPSQTALELEVYERFGIDPARIGYVECHGTGTRLGDPMEIEALTDAFRRHTDRSGYCAVGSVKSNLGHTLTAAGIAGLIKTLLCLEHRQLVPTLHVDALNPYIPFDQTPFYVNTRLRDWTAEPGQGRLAAVSSFGFSGTNVHTVVAEAPARAERPPETPGRPRLVPVSAKTRQALGESLARLRDWLDQHGSDHDWRDVAYTLGVGRSHFAERAVFVATDHRDLSRQIWDWRENAGQDHGPLADVAADFLTGAAVDWEALYSGESCRRIVLPTYPFSTETYWVPQPRSASAPDKQAPDGQAPDRTALAKPAALPDPLPGREIPKPPKPPKLPLTVPHTLRPDDPVLRDHVVDGQPLLPAAVQLALAIQALHRATEGAPITVHQAVWLRPVFVEAERRIEVLIAEQAPGKLTFEVRGTGPDGATLLYTRGAASREPAEAQRVDIAALRARCTREVSVSGYYEEFERTKTHYGPLFRTLKEIGVGAGEGIARLECSDGDDPTLPVGMLDGAIQTVGALIPDDGDGRPFVPFAMERVSVLGPIPRTAYACVRRQQTDKYAVIITDSGGQPCVVIDEFTYRKMEAVPRVELYRPTWRELEPVRDMDIPAAPGGRVVVVATDHDHSLAERIAARHGADAAVVRLGRDDLAGVLTAGEPPRRVYFLGGLDDGSHDLGAPSIETVERSQDHGVRALFRVIKLLLEADAGDRPLDLVAVTANAHAVNAAERTRPLAATLFGLLRSLAKEHQAWRVRCLDIDARELADGSRADVVQAIIEEPAHPRGNEVALRAGRRWARELVPARATEPDRPPFRAGGTYVIAGGARGIGAQLALHLARHAAANLVILGRRPADARIREQVRDLRDAGGQALYLAVDIADESAVVDAVATAKARFGPIHGVFHSAVVLRDTRIANMDLELLDAALAPKVRGLAALAAAVRGEPLEQFVIFSSANSFSGNEGQSNYAAACTFSDAYGRYLADEGVPVHIVNWGYWGETGVVAKAGYRRRMRAVGVHSIGTAEGMRALETVIAAGLPQVMAIKAEARILDRFDIDPVGAGKPSRVDTGSIGRAEPDRVGVEPAGERKPDSVGLEPVGGGEPDIVDPELREAHRELEELCVAMIARAVQRLGAFGDPGDRLATDLGIAPAHGPLWTTMLDILADRGLLDRIGDELAATERLARTAEQDLDARARRLRTERPAVSAHVDLLEHCARDYPRLLTGEVEAAEVMFPAGSAAKVEGIYRGDPLSGRLNELAAAAVSGYVQAQPAGAKVRVLEVGAGTGGTTGAVLDALAAWADRVEYTYTDVSRGFLRHGRRSFGDRGLPIAFRRLDIEADPAGQGFEQGGFDVVVAANVLHATGDLRVTAEHVAWLTAAGGRLVVVEPTAFNVFETCTFGLLEGWWRATDGLRLPGSPVADVPTWERILAAAGFPSTAAQARSFGAAFGHQTLVAERASAPVADAPAPAPASAPVWAEPEPRRSPSGDARESVLDALAASISESLGRSDTALDPDRLFTDYGVDSIILVELVKSLNARLEIDLPTTALFDYPTLGDLADFICAEHLVAPASSGAAGPVPSAPEPSAHEEELDLLQRLASGELSVEDTYALLDAQG
ncbi:MAG: SDR family NAD(P)-dependent oxidoreductase [Catenulispora sp.]|nr:SDR family NAD(P)-dependent oxidoreductase [Catenulispora sp.]